VEPVFKIGDEVIIRETHKRGRVDDILTAPSGPLYRVLGLLCDPADLIAAPKQQASIGDSVVYRNAAGTLVWGKVKCNFVDDLGAPSLELESGVVLHGDNYRVLPPKTSESAEVSESAWNTLAPEGRKDDQDKLRFDLIPPGPLQDLVAVYTMGARKYDSRNWEKGLSWGRVFGAIMRHLWAFWKGEDNDQESGLSHLAHAAWGCFALLEYHQTHPEMDDRSRSGK